MEDHLISRVDQLSDAANLPTDTTEASGEKEPLIPSTECRICQEEDSIKNLEFAHRKCVQRWCNEKRDIICEICHQPYKSGYSAPTPQSQDTACYILSQSLILSLWTIAGSPVDLNDPRVLPMAAENNYDEYEDNSTSAASFCRSAAIILMGLLLLRHALTIGYGGGDNDDDDVDDPSAFFALFVLRAAGFLLPCYIMIWAISILQHRRQSQEREALAAADVAFMIHSGQHRGLQVTIAPGPAMSPTPVIPVPNYP
uniref:RING-CH-type domain-containing protein n=1 Tax=Lactuca sativa TaxID=4236 RepID=A0A9R1VJ21_LACSA|nr:hypothetical protein LSAT_V11C500236080 [Lactuca sativa]